MTFKKTAFLALIQKLFFELPFAAKKLLPGRISELPPMLQLQDRGCVGPPTSRSGWECPMYLNYFDRLV